MNLASRLAKLEQTRPTQSRNGEARKALLKGLESTYARIKDETIDEKWTARQPVQTVISAAMFAPLPLPGPLVQRLDEIAKTSGAPGQLAQTLLEVAQ